MTEHLTISGYSSSTFEIENPIHTPAIELVNKIRLEWSGPDRYMIQWSNDPDQGLGEVGTAWLDAETPSDLVAAVVHRVMEVIDVRKDNPLAFAP